MAARSVIIGSLLALVIVCAASLFALSVHSTKQPEPDTRADTDRPQPTSSTAPSHNVPVPVEAIHPGISSRQQRGSNDQAYGIRMDHPRQKRIWTSARDATFKRSNLDGTNIEVIMSNFESPYAVHVDNTFADEFIVASEGAVYRRLIDRQSADDVTTKLVTLDTGAIHGLGFDSIEGLLYVGDQLGQIKMIIKLPTDQQTSPEISRPTLE